MTSSQVRRLLKQELIGTGHLRAIPGCASEALVLDRSHPGVRDALARGPVELGPGEIRLLQRPGELPSA